jgi:hypothetical protein
VVLVSFRGIATIIPAYLSILGGMMIVTQLARVTDNHDTSIPTLSIHFQAALSLPEDTPNFQSHGLCLWGRQGQGGST